MKERISEFGVEKHDFLSNRLKAYEKWWGCRFGPAAVPPTREPLSRRPGSRPICAIWYEIECAVRRSGHPFLYSRNWTQTDNPGKWDCRGSVYVLCTRIRIGIQARPNHRRSVSISISIQWRLVQGSEQLTSPFWHRRKGRIKPNRSSPFRRFDRRPNPSGSL